MKKQLLQHIVKYMCCLLSYGIYKLIPNNTMRLKVMALLKDLQSLAILSCNELGDVDPVLMSMHLLLQDLFSALKNIQEQCAAFVFVMKPFKFLQL